MTEEFQATLEFFDESVPQTFFCKRCEQWHKTGECKEVNQDGQQPDKEDS